MRQPGQAASIVRRSLLASGPILIDSLAVDPVSESCGDVERQDSNVVVLPFAGVFAKHDAPGKHVVGTPRHALFIAPRRVSRDEDSMARRAHDMLARRVMR